MWQSRILDENEKKTESQSMTETFLLINQLCINSLSNSDSSILFKMKKNDVIIIYNRILNIPI